MAVQLTAAGKKDFDTQIKILFDNNMLIVVKNSF